MRCLINAQPASIGAGRYIALTLGDGAEDDVLAVQPGAGDGGQEELGAVGVGAGVGHGQKARGGVLELEVLQAKEEIKQRRGAK